ncbi:hypothetical protein D3C75_1048440 [compost metagenome]
MLLTLIIVQQMMSGNGRQLIREGAASLQQLLKPLEEPLTVTARDGHEQLFLAFEI